MVFILYSTLVESSILKHNIEPEGSKNCEKYVDMLIRLASVKSHTF